MSPRLAFALLHNELLKLSRRRRPELVFVVLAAFLAISTWAQHRQQEARRGEAAAQGRVVTPTSWRAETERRIGDLERRASRRRFFVNVNRMARFEAARLRYHLAHDIDPGRQTGPLLSRAFAALGSMLLLPLLITVLAADLVSGEASAGTIKMLLTRPVARWKILSAKLAAMAVYATLLVGASALLSWAISGLVFGWRGWSAPVFTGFRFGSETVDLTGVRMAPLWLDTLASYGLGWVSTLTVGTIAVTFSVLFRSSVGAMGTMMATLVAGSLLGGMAQDWTPAMWLFPTNLGLPQLYSGVPPPVIGMTLLHSVLVLAAWSLAAVGTALYVFERRDVTA
jgi:ABC-2 type transport system permease protein